MQSDTLRQAIKKAVSSREATRNKAVKQEIDLTRQVYDAKHQAAKRHEAENLVGRVKSREETAIEKHNAMIDRLTNEIMSDLEANKTLVKPELEYRRQLTDLTKMKKSALKEFLAGRGYGDMNGSRAELLEKARSIVKQDKIDRGY
jgi:hypothetical protein